MKYFITGCYVEDSCCTKGHNSNIIQTVVIVLPSAYCHMKFYICITFYSNINTIYGTQWKLLFALFKGALLKSSDNSPGATPVKITPPYRTKIVHLKFLPARV